jgi:hypothetical protein
MSAFHVGQRVSFYDDDGDSLVIGTVEELSPYNDRDVLVRISPESWDFFSLTAWGEVRNGSPGKFWWVSKDELRHYGPPSTVNTISKLIVSELTM